VGRLVTKRVSAAPVRLTTAPSKRPGFQWSGNLAGYGIAVLHIPYTPCCETLAPSGGRGLKATAGDRNDATFRRK
jgi:hypothetical protein